MSEKFQNIFVVQDHYQTEADTVSVRVHGKSNLGSNPRAQAIADTLKVIKERRPS
jgi:hypothetical protein